MSGHTVEVLAVVVAAVVHAHHATPYDDAWDTAEAATRPVTATSVLQARVDHLEAQLASGPRSSSLRCISICTCTASTPLTWRRSSPGSGSRPPHTSTKTAAEPLPPGPTCECRGAAASSAAGDLRSTSCASGRTG